MNALSPAFVANAKLVTDRTVGFRRSIGRALDKAMQVLHDIYPSKTAANIAVRIGVCTRTAERFVARERDMNAGQFIALLWTDDGGKILKAVMETLPPRERPRWWLRHENSMRLAEIETLQARQDEEIRQLRLDMTR